MWGNVCTRRWSSVGERVYQEVEQCGGACVPGGGAVWGNPNKDLAECRHTLQPGVLVMSWACHIAPRPPPGAVACSKSCREL